MGPRRCRASEIFLARMMRSASSHFSHSFGVSTLSVMPSDRVHCVSRRLIALTTNSLQPFAGTRARFLSTSGICASRPSLAPLSPLVGLLKDADRPRARRLAHLRAGAQLERVNELVDVLFAVYSPRGRWHCHFGAPCARIRE